MDEQISMKIATWRFFGLLITITLKLHLQNSKWRVQITGIKSKDLLHIFIEISIPRFLEPLITNLSLDFRNFKPNDNIFELESASAHAQSKIMSIFNSQALKVTLFVLRRTERIFMQMLDHWMFQQKKGKTYSCYTRYRVPTTRRQRSILCLASAEPRPE